MGEWAWASHWFAKIPGHPLVRNSKAKGNNLVTWLPRSSSTWPPYQGQGTPGCANYWNLLLGLQRFRYSRRGSVGSGCIAHVASQGIVPESGTALEWNRPSP